MRKVLRAMRIPLLLLIAGCIGLCLMSCGENKHTSHVPMTADLPEDVDSLMELAASDGSTRSVDAVLKLRDLGDDRAVPVLENILKKYLGTGSVLGYDAAQALFCIGTERAHGVLSRYLRSPEYDVDASIVYCFGHGMAESKRDAFIEGYHLQSTGKDLAVTLSANPVAGTPQAIDFTVTLENVSDRTLRIHDPKVYLGNLLLLRSPSGHFVGKERTGEVTLDWRGDETFCPVTKTGEKHTWKFQGQLGRREVRVYEDCRWVARKALVLDCGDVVHLIPERGVFRAWAVYCVDSRTAAAKQARYPPGAPMWYGTIVSTPVDVLIQPP